MTGLVVKYLLLILVMLLIVYLQLPVMTCYTVIIFKYFPMEFRELMDKIFSSFVRHCYVSEAMLHGEIRPYQKEKCKSQFDSDNYRPVMNSVNLLKKYLNIRCYWKLINT